MGSRQPDDAPGGVLVLNVAPATPSSSALPDNAPDLSDDAPDLSDDAPNLSDDAPNLPDDAPDLPDNVTLFARHYTRQKVSVGPQCCYYNWP